MKVVNPKNGEILASSFASHEAARKHLKSRLSGDMKDNKFARDIYDATGHEDKATGGRLFWLHKLANQTSGARPEPRKVDMSGLTDMLATAKLSGLKFPSITLTTKSGVEVKVSLAGPKSKYTGSVMIASGGYGVGNPYYGRVTDNLFYAGRDLNQEVEGLLVDLSHDPKGTAMRMGKLTGKCCFCRKSLEHENSVALGYGSTCAKKFGLAHSKKAAASKKTKVEQFVSGELALDMPIATSSSRRIIRRRIESV